MKPKGGEKQLSWGINQDTRSSEGCLRPELTLWAARPQGLPGLAAATAGGRVAGAALSQVGSVSTEPLASLQLSLMSFILLLHPPRSSCCLCRQLGGWTPLLAPAGPGQAHPTAYAQGTPALHPPPKTGSLQSPKHRLFLNLSFFNAGGKLHCLPPRLLRALS